MYLNNTELLNDLARQKLADLHQEANTYRRFKPHRETYRLRLARSLQRLANWLEPEREKEVSHALR